MTSENPGSERLRLIYANMDLGVLEIRIREALVNCKIWGDLNLTKDEYVILTDKIANYKNEMVSHLRFDSLIGCYPFSLVTHAIFFALYDYDDEFWDVWTKKISFDFGDNRNAYYGKAGKRIIQIFENCNFEVFEDDGLKYITPILSQAGIPNSSLYDLFDEINSIKSADFDPLDLIFDLQNTRSHMVRQPVKRYMRFQHEKAVKMFLDIYEIIEDYDSSAFVNSDTNERLLEQYMQWKEIISTRSGRKLLRGDKISPPYISYSDDGRGAVLNLPPVEPPNEYALNVIWLITTTDNNSFEVICKLHRSAEQCRTTEKCIPVECGKGYIISLKEDIGNKAIQEWNIQDLSGAAIVFDGRGKLQSDGFIPSSSGYLIVNEAVCSPEFCDMNFSRVYMPAKSNYSAYFFAPHNAQAVIILKSASNERRLQCKSSLKTSFESQHTLFDEKVNTNGLSLFTSFPKLKFDDFENILPENISIILVHRNTGEKASMDLSEIIHSDKTIVELSSMMSRTAPLYGIYDVRLYEKTSFRKRASFAFVPNIKYDDSRNEYWPTRHSNVSKVELLINTPASVSISFNSDVVEEIEYVHGEAWTKIKSYDTGIYLYGNICVDCGEYKFSVPFQKNVKNMQWAFWQEESSDCELCKSTQRLFVNILAKTSMNLLLSVHRAAFESRPQIELYSKDQKLLQIVDVDLLNNGKFCLPLSTFSTTMESYNPPFDLVIKYQVDTRSASTVIAQICEPVIMKGLHYEKDQETNETPVLKWTKNYTSFEIPMVLRGISVSSFDMPINSNDFMFDSFGNCYIQLDKELKPGTYKVDYSQEDEFFIDKPEFSPPMLSKNNILFVQRELLTKDINSVTKILRNALAFFDSKEYLRKLILFTCKYTDQIDVKINQTTAYFLASILLNIRENNSAGSVGEMYHDLVRHINTYIISDLNRGQITKYLLQLNLNQKALAFCIEKLNLYMFSVSEDCLLTAEELHILFECNKQLGLLWIIRQKEAPKFVSEKILSVIGPDSIKEILTIKPMGCNPESWDLCFEKYVEGSCCKPCSSIHLSDKYCGDSKVFRSMFEWGSRYNEPKLNVTKKPNDQIYFAGQQYVDILISWYFRKINVSSETFKSIEQKMRLQKSIDAEQKKLSREASGIISKYYSVLYCRQIEDAGGFYPFFYYIALSSLHSYLYRMKLISIEEYKFSEWFLIESMDLIPELVIRDLLAVDVYMYLKEREIN